MITSIELKDKYDVYAKQVLVWDLLKQAQRKRRTNVINNIGDVFTLVEDCLDAMDNILSKSYQNGMSAYIDYTDRDYSAAYVRKYGMPAVTRIGVTINNNKLILHVTREKLASDFGNKVHVNMSNEQKQKAKEQIFKRFAKNAGYSIN